MSMNINEIWALLDANDLTRLFERLGWDRPSKLLGAVDVPETGLRAEMVAAKLGVGVWRVDSPTIPPRPAQHRVARVLSQHTTEHLIVFVSDDGHLWLWPEQRASGVGYRLVAHRHTRGRRNHDLLQRLADTEFKLEDDDSLTVLHVLERVRRSFNVERVTKRFYGEFKKHHDRLTDQIEGIEGADDRGWYASVLLNRLMFVYFVQRKGFLDNDSEYLRTRLSLVRQRYDADEPCAFFGRFLLPFFHQALGLPPTERTYDDAAIEQIIGTVPYVNGGIFEPHPLEICNSIVIADTALEEVLDFFDAYRWQLDERPTGKPDEINPDVLGYIFEQHINQKQQGAYYTKADVTGYMSEVTILPVLVDRLLEAGLDSPLVLLSADPDRYLPESLRHGIDRALPDGLTPGDRADPSYGLPGETWSEVLDRHAHYARLRRRLEDQSVETVNEAVTANVALRPLLADYLRMGNAHETQLAFDALRRLTVCDPTCGSGAFLFAALDLLDEMYQAVLDRAFELDLEGHGTLAFRDEAWKHRNERYWALKTICLNNLYGVDLMPEAAEIARLRLFLKLAAQIDDVEDLEPLPDLDLNIKWGNLLVGIADLADADSRFGHDAIAQRSIPDISERVKAVSHMFPNFIAAQASTGDRGRASELKAEMLTALDDMRSELDEMLHTARAEHHDLNSWVDSHVPFHWFIEFPSIFTKGGFDAIIGNPPYISAKKITDYRWQGFRTGACPDIYAPCVERSSGLLTSKGRFSMILPHSVSFSGRFQVLRNLLRLRFPEAWASSYARIPAGLFTNDTRVRNTIFVGRADGARDRGRFGVMHTTRCRRWISEYRPHLFETTRYTTPEPSLASEFWPFVDSTELATVFARLVQECGAGIGQLTMPRNGTARLGFKTNAYNWLSVFADEPPAEDQFGRPTPQTEISWLNFPTEPLRDLALICLAGKWAYAWWVTYGDDFHVTKRLLESFPVNLQKLAKSSQAVRLLELATELQTEMSNHVVYKLNAGKRIGNYDLNACRHLTDEADQLLADFWNTHDKLPAVNLLQHQTIRADC